MRERGVVMIPKSRESVSKRGKVCAVRLFPWRQQILGCFGEEKKVSFLLIAMKLH